MIEQTFGVIGMACGSCATFVSEEVRAVPGVRAVAVDLAADTVTVTSTHPLDLTDVRTAVERAGYELSASAPSSPPGPATGSPAGR